MKVLIIRQKRELGEKGRENTRSHRMNSGFLDSIDIWMYEWLTSSAVSTTVDAGDHWHRITAEGNDQCFVRSPLDSYIAQGIVVLIRILITNINELFSSRLIRVIHPLDKFNLISISFHKNNFELCMTFVTNSRFRRLNIFRFSQWTRPLIQVC